ncbi:MAG TPA: HlyD family type I secretion periplasmic adaptor subunit, partial [Burkholderiaceae bacterium]|nr:HlyD family type I secretion periplasmic adaptor subunit [Burkholderiaceae bacterium]
MSGENDNLAAPERAAPPRIQVAPGADAAAPDAPPPTLRDRLRAWRRRLDAWLEGAPLQPGEIPGMAVFEREAVEVMSRQHTLRARKIVRIALFVVAALLVWAAFARVDEVTRGD